MASKPTGAPAPTISQKLVQEIMDKSGLNISQLAEELTKFRGHKLHRQQLQDWLHGRTTMRVDTAETLKEFKKRVRKKR